MASAANSAGPTTQAADAAAAEAHRRASEHASLELDVLLGLINEPDASHVTELPHSPRILVATPIAAPSGCSLSSDSCLPERLSGLSVFPPFPTRSTKGGLLRLRGNRGTNLPPRWILSARSLAPDAPDAPLDLYSAPRFCTLACIREGFLRNYSGECIYAKMRSDWGGQTKKEKQAEKQQNKKINKIGLEGCSAQLNFASSLFFPPPSRSAQFRWRERVRRASLPTIHFPQQCLEEGGSRTLFCHRYIQPPAQESAKRGQMGGACPSSRWLTCCRRGKPCELATGLASAPAGVHLCDATKITRL